MKLLIIEDELDMLNALKKGFLIRNYAVDTAEDGESASYLASVNDYDVIILDLNLPKKDGIEVLREIRQRDLTQKIIVLSARSSVQDKIYGLDTGANDYLAKPFDFLELEARVRSLVRRDFIQRDTRVKLGNLTVDTARNQAWVGEEKIELAPKEFAILEYLFLHAGRIVSQEELIEHIWASDADLFSGAIKVHMSNLRKKLDAFGVSHLIRTIRGSGYLVESEEHRETN